MSAWDFATELVDVLANGESVMERGGRVIHPKAVFPPELWPKLLTAIDGSFGLPELVENFPRLGYSWDNVDDLTMVLCAHGLCVVKLASHDSLSDRGQFHAIARSCLLSVPDEVCCTACVKQYKPYQSSGKHDIGYISEDEESFFGKDMDCFLRAFPVQNHIEAWAKCGPAPPREAVTTLLTELGCGSVVLKKPVTVQQKGEMLHVSYGGPVGQTYSDVLAKLLEFDPGLHVAGACGNLGSGYLGVPACASCRAHRPPLTRRLDDATGCVCGEPGVIPGVWASNSNSHGMHHHALSATSRENAVIVVARAPMDKIGHCTPFHIGETEVAQVRLHKEGNNGYFNVEGYFVQVLIPPDIALVLEGGVSLAASPYPTVLAANGRVSAHVYGQPHGLLARGRSHSAKIRWMHSVIAEDPADTFARFWTSVGPKLGLFSFGPSPIRVGTWLGGNAEIENGSINRRIAGSLCVQGGFLGSAVLAESGGIRIENIVIDRGGSVVFGREVSSRCLDVKTNDGTYWTLTMGVDAYELDDGGPSGSDGFYDEF